MQYWMGVKELSKLSISEILRIANHDFINQLQLIKMYLDLNRIDEAKHTVEHYCTHYKTFSHLVKLQWPQTIEWIQTFHFRFPAIEFTLKCNVTSAQDMKKDDETVEYLEEAVQHIYPHLDPYCEQKLMIQVESHKEDFQLLFDLKGKWDVESFQNQPLLNMKVKTIEESPDSWKFVLTFKE